MHVLPQFVCDMLASPPRAGDGVHQWMFRVARQLHVHRQPDEIVQILAATLHNCGRTVPLAEIEEAVTNSAVCAWRPGAPLLPVVHRQEWPVRNPEAIAALVATASAPTSLADLFDASPIRFDEEDPVVITEAIIDHLMPGNPLLCCGAGSATFATKPRDQWRGQLASLQFIVPSPMRALAGDRLNKPGQSAHTRDNTGPRRFLVIEFDQGTIAEQCAALWRLADHLPLVLILHSGGKSLHGWFYCAGCDEGDLHRFMRFAVHLGADRRLWLREQFVRMPEGLRPGPPPRRQTVFYFAPKESK